MTDKHDVVKHADVTPIQALHPAVERILENNPSPEVLEKLLALQERWEESQARRAYSAALVALRHDLPSSIPKDKRVDFSGARGRVTYSHASLAAAMEAVTPALTKHGFSLAWTPSVEDGRVTVTARLTHSGGHSETAALSAPPDSSGLKSPPQAIASTMTLLERYTALALLGIATADMTEDESEAKPSEESVDTARNVKAAAAINRAGLKIEDAEHHVGRKRTEWTGADLDKLREWIKTEKTATTQA